MHPRALISLVLYAAIVTHFVVDAVAFQLNSPQPLDLFSGSLNPTNASVLSIFSRQSQRCNTESEDEHATALQSDNEKENWQRAKCKGAELDSLQRLTREDATAKLNRDSEAPYHDANWVVENGWSESELFGKNALIKYALGDALASINIPPETGRGSNNRVIQWIQNAFYTVSGKRYPPTAAGFYNIFNPVDNFIGCYYNFGPQSQLISRMDEVTPIPALSRWSDVIFQGWQKLKGDGDGPIEAPRYIMRIDVANFETVDTIGLALNFLTCQPPLTGREKFDWPLWPGITFSTAHTKGKVIMSTPNMLGIAWMLINRKTRFGTKVVTEITIWRSANNKKHILAKIEDA
ncbi:hypothetical protein EJ06DRAFT_170080 [Trichodelitschia bisporula]|uniref:Uncharacterized protein n=1 Tax=Trichodelitschia bisporula TaxID=703511 RepID=A0A6G1HLL0_9PEZI|nr:hypothetical protein EJ06DRAFT_170080 [Trichodelitschia bisporula]